MTYQPTAAQLARVDQAYAGCADAVADLIEAHRAVIAGAGDREVRTVELARFLRGQLGHTACAELLAVAVDLLTTT